MSSRLHELQETDGIPYKANTQSEVLDFTKPVIDCSTTDELSLNYQLIHLSPPTRQKNIALKGERLQNQYANILLHDHPPLGVLFNCKCKIKRYDGTFMGMGFFSLSNCLRSILCTAEWVQSAFSCDCHNSYHFTGFMYGVQFLLLCLWYGVPLLLMSISLPASPNMGINRRIQLTQGLMDWQSVALWV